MSTFQRLDPSDFVISADAISSTCWTNGNPTLTQFYTSSVQAAGSSGNYYINVYQTSSLLSGSAVQFAIAYGNAQGSGSANYNNLVDGASPTSTVFGQYQVLVIGDENTNFTFGSVTGSEFFALSVERACYKESLFLGSMALRITGSSGSITLTDNSNYVTSTTFTSAGRVYQLISGSTGVKFTGSAVTSDGFSINSGSYGWFLPDIGTILLNPMALADFPASGGIGLAYSGSYAWGPQVRVATGSTAPNLSPNASMFNALSGSGASAGSFQLNSQETISSDFVFVRPRSNEFNYSENPSFISGSTGEVLYSSFINNPTTYITTVGLYNDANELLAVAKLSRPLPKDFTTEALVRVKLDF